jgi:hypothetical protein
MERNVALVAGRCKSGMVQPGQELLLEQETPKAKSPQYSRRL